MARIVGPMTSDDVSLARVAVELTLELHVSATSGAWVVVPESFEQEVERARVEVEALVAELEVEVEVEEAPVVSTTPRTAEGLSAFGSAQDLRTAARNAWIVENNAGRGYAFDSTDVAGTSLVLASSTDGEVDDAHDSPLCAELLAAGLMRVRRCDSTGDAILVATDAEGHGWAVRLPSSRSLRRQSSAPSVGTPVEDRTWYLKDRYGRRSIVQAASLLDVCEREVLFALPEDEWALLVERVDATCDCGDNSAVREVYEVFDDDERQVMACCAACARQRQAKPVPTRFVRWVL